MIKYNGCTVFYDFIWSISFYGFYATRLHICRAHLKYYNDNNENHNDNDISIKMNTFHPQDDLDVLT